MLTDRHGALANRKQRAADALTQKAVGLGGGLTPEEILEDAKIVEGKVCTAPVIDRPPCVLAFMMCVVCVCVLLVLGRLESRSSCCRRPAASSPRAPPKALAPRHNANKSLPP